MTNEDDFEWDPPPSDPGAEPRLPGHAFDAECLAFCKNLLRKNVAWGERVVTQTEKWGLVWRADYKDPDIDFQHLVNRMTCWRSPTGDILSEDAILQNIAPLER